VNAKGQKRKLNKPLEGERVTGENINNESGMGHIDGELGGKMVKGTVSGGMIHHQNLLNFLSSSQERS